MNKNTKLNKKENSSSVSPVEKVNPVMIMFKRNSIDTSVFENSDGFDNDIIFVMRHGEKMKTSKYLMSLACPKISTFINQSQCCIVPCIYLPDYSSETLAVLIELLSTGKTVTIQKSKIDFEEMKDLAAELGLDGNGFLQAM